MGLFGDTASNFTRSTDSTPSFIFLVLRKNPSKIEALGLFVDTATNITRSTFARRRSFSLSYEKILQKSRFLGLCRNARSNVTRSTFARCCSFSLSYEKILQKSRFWVFSVILRQISLGVPTVRRRSFSLSYEKILQKSRFLGLCRNARSNFARSTDSTPSFIFLVLRKNPSKIESLGLFGDTATNVTRSTFVRRRSFSDRATKCVTRFTFNTNFNLCHLRGDAQIYIKQELFKRQTIQAPL